MQGTPCSRSRNKTLTELQQANHHNTDYSRERGGAPLHSCSRGRGALWSPNTQTRGTLWPRLGAGSNCRKLFFIDSFTSMMAAMLPAAQCWQSSVQRLVETQADLPGEVLHPSRPHSGCSDNPSDPPSSAASRKRNGRHVRSCLNHLNGSVRWHAYMPSSCSLQ